MKRILILLAFFFSASAASAQDKLPVQFPKLKVVKPLSDADKAVNRRFSNQGITLMNSGGSIPEPHSAPRPKSEQQQPNEPQAEKLITRNLLFTGKLSDHISRPLMIYRDSIGF